MTLEPNQSDLTTPELTRSWWARVRPLRPLATLLLLYLAAVWWSLDSISEYEATARDVQTRASGPRRATGVVVVRIDEADYRDLFGGRSPLEPRMVERLVSAILLGRPRLVGVDLDTSDPPAPYRVAPALRDAVVWASVPIDQPLRRDSLRSDTPPAPPCTDRYVVPSEPLGGQPSADGSGIVALEPDAHGTLRLYRRILATPSGFAPSLPWVLASRAGGPIPRTAQDSLCPRYIEYRNGSRLSSYRASEIIALATPDTRDGAPPDGYTGQFGPLAGQIVLIGGAFRAARDQHRTPLGVQYGVDVLAQVVETELDGGGPLPPKPWAIGAIIALVPLILIVAFRTCSTWTALAVSAIATLLLVGVANQLWVGSAFLSWPHVLPFLALIVAEQLFEHANDERKKLLSDMTQRVGNGGRLPRNDAGKIAVEHTLPAALAAIRTAPSRARGFLKRRDRPDDSTSP